MASAMSSASPLLHNLIHTSVADLEVRVPTVAGDHMVLALRERRSFVMRNAAAKRQLSNHVAIIFELDGTGRGSTVLTGDGCREFHSLPHLRWVGKGSESGGCRRLDHFLL